MWVAAADACQNDCSSSHGHFGHHDHEMAGDSSAAFDVAADALADFGDTGGVDHSTSHGHGCPAVVAESGLAATGERPSCLPFRYERFVADRFLDHPLRPPSLPPAAN